MTAATGPEVERLLRRRMPADLRIRVALEIVATYLQVRRRMLRGDVRDVVARLRLDAVDAHDPYVA